MQMNNTKCNHFVPRFYLKEFCDDNSKIWKWDLINNNIYNPNNLKAECSKKNLYTVKTKITQKDIDIIKKVFQQNMTIMCEQTLNYLAIFLNDEIGNILTITYTKDKDIKKRLNDSINESLNNNNISRTQEIIITELYENRFAPLYKQILETNSIDFLNQTINDNIALYVCTNITIFVYLYLQRKLEEIVKTKIPKKLKTIKLKKNAYFDFILYFILQDVRTENVINKLKESTALSKLSQYVNINDENFSFLTMTMLVIVIAEKLFYKNTPFKFILLKNDTNIKFVTSDSPCVNIYSSFIKDRFLQDNEIEFLFPLSPDLALLMTEKPCYVRNNITIKNDKDIDIYNKTLIKTAKRYVYANSLNLINRYRIEHNE